MGPGRYRAFMAIRSSKTDGCSSRRYFCIPGDSNWNVPTHLYNATLSLRDWSAAPAVNGQAYDIKFTNNAFDYYGLYRIDDRILAGWSTLIMKNSAGNQQSADINRTAGNKQELYMCGATVTTKTSSSNEYKAMAFLYDLISHRGAASYDGFNFSYSICATSPEDAYGLVGRFDEFSADIKTLLASATVRTYNVEGEYGEADENKAYANISDMVDALRPIAAKYNPGSCIKSVLTLSNTNNATLIIVVISSLVLLSVGGFFFIRKRKENN